MINPVVEATVTRAELDEWLAACFTMEAYEQASVSVEMEDVRAALYDLHALVTRFEVQYGLDGDRSWWLSRSTGNIGYND